MLLMAVAAITPLHKARIAWTVRQEIEAREAKQKVCMVAKEEQNNCKGWKLNT